jgi:hypothetical protein
VAVAGGGAVGVAVATTPTTDSTPSVYSAIAPQSYPTRNLADSASTTYVVTGGATGVPANATSVVLQVTASNGSSAGKLKVYPQDNPTGAPAVLYWTAGKVATTQLTVPVGTTGAVTALNGAGTVTVNVKLAGYFAPGSAGQDGKSVLNGAGPPADSTGNDGDFYVDTTNNLFYGPKAGGVWPANPVSLVGPPGDNGVSVTSSAETAGTNCAAGGSKFTAANGVTYACNGADGSTDAQTLSGHPLADFKLRCQAGYVPFGGMCWQYLDSNGWTAATAASHCAAEGARLPTLSEFMGVINAGFGLGNGGVVLDWASDRAADASSVFIDSTSDPNNLDGTSLNTVTHYARCIAAPTNGLGS